MSSDLFITPLGVIVALLALSWVNACESALACANPIRLKHRAQQGVKIAVALQHAGTQIFTDLLIWLCLCRIVLAGLSIELTLQFAMPWYWVLLWLPPLQLGLAELAPRTLAHRFADQVVEGLYRPLHPLRFIVRLLHRCAAFIERQFTRLNASQTTLHQHGQDELNQLMHEHSAISPNAQASLLLDVLALSEAQVDDVMVPRAEIVALDVQDDWRELQRELALIQHSKVLLYRDSLEDVLGFIHSRDLMRMQLKEPLTKASLLRSVHDVYYIPSGTTLAVQLQKFQQSSERIGLVVDEFGDVKGLLTLEDLLAELLGQLQRAPEPVLQHSDGSFVLDASCSLRDLNRQLHLHLPTDGPKTLNGLILEKTESLPAVGTELLLDAYIIQIVATDLTMVTQVRLLKPEQSA